MLKLLLLGGVVLLGGFIGTSGVLRVTARRDALRELQNDIKLMENAMTMQKMTFPAALGYVAQLSRVGTGYHKLAQELRQNVQGGRELFDDDALWRDFAKAELGEKERGMIRGYFLRIADCVTAQEISLATAGSLELIARELREIEQRELGRARVLRTVWLLAGVGVAVILL